MVREIRCGQGGRDTTVDSMSGVGRSQGFQRSIVAEQLASEALGVVSAAVPSLTWDRAEMMATRPGKAVIVVVGGSPHPRRVVAKLQAPELACLERRVYEEVLGPLGLPSVMCVGVHESLGDPTNAWLLTEFGKGYPFEPSSSAHAEALARWISALHAGAPGVIRPEVFPDHGETHWHRVVSDAMTVLQGGLSNRSMGIGDLGSLRDLSVLLAHVLDQWEDMIVLMKRLPETLTHGDLVPKHITVRVAGPTVIPLIIDWGEAGWGTPLIDFLWVDTPICASQVGLTEAEVSRMKVLGAVLWTAFVLEGDRANLASRWPHHASMAVCGYVAALRRQDAGRLVGGAW